MCTRKKTPVSLQRYSRMFVILLVFDSFLIAPAVADTYFDEVSSMPEVIAARAYDSQAEINADIHANNSANRVRPPVYDAEIGGARWTISSGSGSIAIQDQLRPTFPNVSSGNLLVIWEARWDPAFPQNENGLETHKAFQLSREGSGDERRIEVRTRFSQASPPAVAKVDVRTYIWSPAQQPLSGQSRDFTIKGGKWTRFWAFVDFSSREFSLWIADEDTHPVRVFDKRQFSSMSGGLNNFWFEFNSSQSRSGGASLNVWGRNFIALRNVSNVESIVSGGTVDGGNAVVAPMPPQNVIAE